MEFEWFDGHIILDEGGRRVLLDTGSPRSVGMLRGWSFQGVPVTLEPEVQGVTAESLSRYVGTQVDVLLGMDFLGARTFEVDVGHRRFRIIPTTETLPTGHTIPIKIIGGVPTVTVEIGPHPIRAVLDTGAKLSYLTNDMIGNYTTVGRVRDFHPTTGPFQSDMRLVSAQLGTASVTLRCGTLPPMVEAGLRVLGLRGIVGNDLLERFVATFVMPKQLILK